MTRGHHHHPPRRVGWFEYLVLVLLVVWLAWRFPVAYLAIIGIYLLGKLTAGLIAAATTRRNHAQQQHHR